jgi:hypothetical protein
VGQVDNLVITHIFIRKTRSFLAGEAGVGI